MEKYITEHYPDECTFDTVDMQDGSWRQTSFAEYDVVFHVAGIAHQKETKENAPQYYTVNRDLAIEVARKTKADRVKQFIFLSSMSVYGLLKGRISEETLLKPKTNYGKSKLQAEEGIICLQDDTFKVCILRPPMIYGKGCKGNYLSLRKFALKMKLFPYVRNERSMLYIENLCEFVRLMIANEESGIFFPQNSEYTNTSEMVKMIAAAHGRKLKLMRGTAWAVRFMGLFTGLVKKAFGNLTYDKTMSAYKEEYAKYSLVQSIEETENE
ncbi:MAG: NAD-dependent epimerase/dehydratase family protein [Clostridiales bacterium]|nr:NAD-dependent epimerase/dehydratase family protein [Clostridiales bacterium]